MPERLPENPSAEAIEASFTPQEKAAEALKLKKAGFSYGYIAKHLKYSSRTSVLNAVRKELQRETGKVDKDMMRSLDTERTEEMFKFLQPKIRKGEPRAIEVGIRILERRARMFGYDEVDRVSDQEKVAPVTIVYMPHREDLDAQRYISDIIDHPALPSHVEEGSPLLEAPTEGVILDGE